MEKRFLDWSSKPLSNVSLSASGLLVLADLSTIAKRTALTGTSSWLDILVLAPGIHYQQSADSLTSLPLDSIAASPTATNVGTGATKPVTNVATIRYLNRVGSMRPQSGIVTLDVGGTRTRTNSLRLRQARRTWRSKTREVRTAVLSPILFLLTPVLTVAAAVMMVLTQDWWGVGIIAALMAARALNIWIIRNRTQTQIPKARDCVCNLPHDHKAHSDPGADSEDETQQQQHWQISLPPNRTICLRGFAHDLEALTTGTWMREKTNIEGYMEAMAKLIVYMVAAFSGNMYQTGNIILMILLLVSAGLLALSNSHEEDFSMNGRFAILAGDGDGDGVEGVAVKGDTARSGDVEAGKHDAVCSITAEQRGGETIP